MKLHHHIVGDGPPLIILHGLLGSLDNWMPHARVWSAQFQVCLLDLRNHGRSPHADEFDYDLMAADVVEFLQAQSFSSAHLLGHSMGGKVAMRIAQQHPELTRRLIVADMAPREYAPRYAEILATLDTLELGRYHQRQEVEAVLATVVPELGMRQFLLKNLGRDEAGQLRWKPNVAALRANYHRVRGRLPADVPFPGPALFVRGGDSDYIRDEDFGLIQQLFPQAELETIPGVGHWLHAEAPIPFMQLCADFLRREP